MPACEPAPAPARQALDKDASTPSRDEPASRVTVHLQTRHLRTQKHATRQHTVGGQGCEGWNPEHEWEP